MAHKLDILLNMSVSKMGINVLSEMNAHQVTQSINDDTVAVLIFGACENHGDHMPFGSDFIMPFELAKRVANRCANLVILPPFPYGVSSHLKDFFMTITVEPDTMIMIIHNILVSLVNNKITRILIINGHDGNIAPIESAARIMKDEHPEVIISCLEQWWVLVGKLNNDLFDVWDGLGHGGEAETSVMIALRPELVDMNHAPREIIPTLPEHVRIYWKQNELTDTGATGAPQKANANKGNRALQVLEDVLVSFIKDMDKKGWRYGINAEKCDLKNL